MSFTPLTAEQLRARLDAAPGRWLALPGEFPAKMRALRGEVNGDVWLAVEHDDFDGQPGTSGYDGAMTTRESHIYRIPPELAEAAYKKGRASLDAERQG